MHFHFENMILINGNTLKLNNYLNFHELLISLILFKPNCKNIAIKASVISKELLYERKFIECIKLYEKYGINLVFVNDIGLENLNNYLKVVIGKCRLCWPLCHQDSIVSWAWAETDLPSR